RCRCPATWASPPSPSNASPCTSSSARSRFGLQDRRHSSAARLRCNLPAAALKVRPFMTAILEREVKLRFDSADAARTAVIAAGAEPIRSRRLQEDCRFDTADETPRRRRCELRVRMESGKSLLTYKGPVQPSDMPLREELETIVAD